MERKALSLLLLLFLSIDPVLGNFAWLHYKKILVRKAVQRHLHAGMDKGDLQLLTFSVEEAKTKLRWEHSREFEYNNHMYDIVETRTVGDTVYFWCWRDDQETSLNRRLEQLAALTLRKHPKSLVSLSLMISTFKMVYAAFSSALNEFRPGWEVQPLFFLFARLVSIPIQPPTPPPRLK